MKKKFFYVFWNFLKFFIIISIIFVIFFLIFQVLDDLTDFFKYKKPIIFKNYIYTLPLLFVQISPIITILSLMLIISEMIKNNELKVLFISGIKPLYIFSIFLICGFFSSIFTFSVKNFLSPKLIKKVSYQKLQNSIAFSSSNYFFYSDKLYGNKFINVEFSEYLESGEIVTIKAERAENYKDTNWIFINGYFWRFDDNKNLILREKFSIKNVNIPLTAEILSISNIDVEKFSLFQLKKIIKKMVDLKLKPISLITYFNEKISYPLLNFFITFLLYTFLTKSSKISNLYVFSFSFLFFLFIYSIYIFFFSLSKNAKLNPFIGTWIVHFCVLIYFFIINLKKKVLK
ncbi:MAG: LptF/LptG family permease [Candidatus Omnitrophica bacterium]|nr:LptF/LptG family permease [Candidatus Omnitrophota bacterium]